MKQLLLVLLMSLAYTKGTIGKSPFKEIARRQNVLDSPVSSPNGLSTVRKLKQDTTLDQAEDAEERGPPPLQRIHLPLEIEGGSSSLHETFLRLDVDKLDEPPATLFKRLPLGNKEELFKSQEFKKWFEAVHVIYEKDPGNTIIGSLFHIRIPEFDLATLLFKAKDASSEGMKTYEYFLLNWKDKKNIDPKDLYAVFRTIEEDRVDDTLPYIWRDYAKLTEMPEEDATELFNKLKLINESKSPPKKHSSPDKKLD